MQGREIESLNCAETCPTSTALKRNSGVDGCFFNERGTSRELKGLLIGRKGLQTIGIPKHRKS